MTRLHGVCWVALAAVLLASCGGGGGGPPCPRGSPAPGVETLQLAATSTSIPQRFSVSIEGDGGGVVKGLHFDSVTGTAAIGAAVLPTLIYGTVLFDDFLVVEALAVSDRLLPLWFYCQGGKLAYTFSESADGLALASTPSSGTCTVDPVSGAGPRLPLALPALAIPFDHRNLEQQIVFNGPALRYDGLGPGSLRTDREWELLPFQTVDCTGCGDGGWYETHALLWDAHQGLACFAILYTRGPGSPVQLVGETCLPGDAGSGFPDAAATLLSGYLQADWSLCR